MGSLDKACISGFLCRLCSEMHRTVIHIYGDQGKRLCLVEKINGYLPITISPTDPLPKTICRTCLHRVEQHYSLLMRLTKMRQQRQLKLDEKQNKRPATCDVSSAEASDEDSAREESQEQSSHTHKEPSSSSSSEPNTETTTTTTTSTVIAASPSSPDEPIASGSSSNDTANSETLSSTDLIQIIMTGNIRN